MEEIEKLNPEISSAPPRVLCRVQNSSGKQSTNYFGQRHSEQAVRFDEQALCWRAILAFGKEEGRRGRQETSRRPAGGHQQRGPLPRSTSATTHSPSSRALHARKKHARRTHTSSLPPSLPRSLTAGSAPLRQPSSTTTTSLAAA